MTSSEFFVKSANTFARASGTPTSFLIATLTVVVWLATGPIFHYSDTWQLVMNTWTNVVTFLMVFLIQNSQNRDSGAIQVKLDELGPRYVRVDRSHHSARSQAALAAGTFAFSQ
jgi:low affinity Fe/Cu permease